jgi:hypothetical protein
MNVPCPNANYCPGSDNPVGNFSSEAPDVLWNYTMGYPPYIPTVWHGLPGDGCAVACANPSSPELARLCAVSGATQCQLTTGGQQPFYNVGTSCSMTCPDGSLFTWFVAPGWFVGPNQSQVDTQASNYACRNVSTAYFCLSDIPLSGTVGSPYSSMISTKGKFGPYHIDVLTRSVPPGLTFQNAKDGSLIISGTPTAPGTFNFTAQGTDNAGNTSQRNYVMTIAPQPATQDCASFFANPSWSLSQGHPPPGTFGSATGSGPNFSLFSNQPVSAGNGPQVTASWSPALTYSWTTPLSCTLHLDTAGGSGAGGGYASLSYWDGNSTVFLYNKGNTNGLAPGDYAFTIPGNALWVSFITSCNSGDGSGATGQFSISGWFAVTTCASIWQRVGNSSGTIMGDTNWESIVSPTTGGHGAIATANAAGIQINAYADATTGGTGTLRFGYGTPALPVSLMSPLTCKLTVNITQNIAPNSLTATIVANLTGGGTTTVFSGTLFSGANLFTIPANVATLTVSVTGTAGINGHINMNGTFGNYP